MTRKRRKKKEEDKSKAKGRSRENKGINNQDKANRGQRKSMCLPTLSPNNGLNEPSAVAGAAPRPPPPEHKEIINPRVPVKIEAPPPGIVAPPPPEPTAVKADPPL